MTTSKFPTREDVQVQVAAFVATMREKDRVSMCAWVERCGALKIRRDWSTCRFNVGQVTAMRSIQSTSHIPSAAASLYDLLVEERDRVARYSPSKA